MELWMERPSAFKFVVNALHEHHKEKQWGAFGFILLLETCGTNVAPRGVKKHPSNEKSQFPIRFCRFWDISGGVSLPRRVLIRHLKDGGRWQRLQRFPQLFELTSHGRIPLPWQWVVDSFIFLSRIDQNNVKKCSSNHSKSCQKCPLIDSRASRNCLGTFHRSPTNVKEKS